jgi:hypothetical protein
MGRVVRGAGIGAVGILLALSSASAQNPRADEGPAPLEIKRAGKPPLPIVRPEADRGQATRDAATAAAEYEQRKRDEALMREQTQSKTRRPDLGYDVTGSIQQRNINRR